MKIIGTDTSERVVEYARRGRYRRLEVNHGLPGRLVLKYFQRDGDEWVATSEIRDRCEFRHANLCDDLPGLPVFDLVLLRNVLLYLLPKDRALIFSEIFRRMSRDSYLLLGNAEQPEDSTNLFKPNCFQMPVFTVPCRMAGQLCRR